MLNNTIFILKISIEGFNTDWIKRKKELMNSKDYNSSNYRSKKKMNKKRVKKI